MRFASASVDPLCVPFISMSHRRLPWVRRVGRLPSVIPYWKILPAWARVACMLAPSDYARRITTCNTSLLTVKLLPVCASARHINNDHKSRDLTHFWSTLTAVSYHYTEYGVPLHCWNPACSSVISVLTVFNRILSSMIRRRILLACETRAIVL